MMGTFEEPQICIKIMVYDKCHVDQVVYYRNKLPMWIVEKWRWYFEYIAAAIKVANPRRKVELIICAQTFLQGDEYIEAKRASLLRAKRSKLKKLENEPIAKDLFGFEEESINSKINAVRSEINDLENGIVNFYVPAAYINLVKQWTKKTK